MATSDEERRAADEFYIVATDTSHDERTRVLKQDVGLALDIIADIAQALAASDTHA